MRTVLLVAHTERRQICAEATRAARQLVAAGLGVRMLPSEARHVSVDGVTTVDADAGVPGAEGAEVVLTLGGDGTFLRAAELARPAGVPMLGVNLGHVGFLAEAEPNALDATVDAIIQCAYSVEERVTVEAEVFQGEVSQARAWALNEVSLERASRERMLEIAVAVDFRPLLRFGCDGILCATPTGSTAYAFSAGGPIMWPNVDALLLVPNAAHALFARPVIVAPSSTVDIDLLSAGHEAVLSCDGRRSLSIKASSRVRITRGALPVRIARWKPVGVSPTVSWRNSSFRCAVCVRRHRLLTRCRPGDQARPRGKLPRRASGMLEELRIRGLGVIDDAVLPLGPGLTVVTGETGAGKTMVVSGLLLLFGGRADAARVRAGVEQAVVDGRLEIAAGSAAAERVRAAGGDLDDGTGLVLRRSVSAAGRSRAYVGGAPTPVSVLAELAERLVAVHGQSEQLRLVRPAEQRAALDRFGGIELQSFQAVFRAWCAAADTLAERVARTAELRREADLLAHGVAEIEAVAPQPGEDLELSVLAGRLAHADGLRRAAQAAHDALLGAADDPGADRADVVGLIGTARRLLDRQPGGDPGLEQLAARLTELADLAAELGADFGGYGAGLEADPARLEQIETRRAVLTRLIRKYGEVPDADLVAVQDWAERARRRLTDIDVSDEALAALRARRDEAAAQVTDLARGLSTARQEAASRLATAVTAELAGLAMPRAVCSVVVGRRPPSAGAPALTIDAARTGVGPDGIDEVEFLLQADPDAPALPLGRAASGGELARVMLAVEVCLAGTDPLPTMVFDEVDAGVGGRAALEVGRRLARLSRDHQVLAVTHLAQVAAYADRHVVVDKHTRSSSQRAQAGRSQDGSHTELGITASDVRVVTGPDRLAELARMLGGSASDTALEHAAELLRTAAGDAGATATGAGATGDAHTGAVPVRGERRKPVKTRS